MSMASPPAKDRLKVEPCWSIVKPDDARLRLWDLAPGATHGGDCRSQDHQKTRRDWNWIHRGVFHCCVTTPKFALVGEVFGWSH